MSGITFPSSIVFSPSNTLIPALGATKDWHDPAVRRVYLKIDSNGLGDVVNVVPLVQEITTLRPDIEVVIISSQWRIPFRWCAEKVATIATAPTAGERTAPGALYFDLSAEVRYHLHAPHWLQFYFITGIGTYTQHPDPFPLLKDSEVGEFTSRLSDAIGDTRGYVLMHLENTRREWEGRNTDPENLLLIARKLADRGYRIFEIGNDNPPSGEFEHLGKLTLEELVYAMRDCAGFVGIDSFPIHVAALYDKPILGFFAATQPDVVLPPVSRLTALRNEAIPCNGCVYITRPRYHNKCTLAHLECTQRLPAAYLHERFERFLGTIESPASTPIPTHALEHSWRMAQLLFEQSVLLDRLRGRRFLSNALRRCIAASISSELV